jgi:hypothetical protein
MRITLLFLLVGVLLMSIHSGLGRAQCPEDPRDNGICDTLHFEVYPPDTMSSGLVRVGIYMTHDVPDPVVDSIGAFFIPLCCQYSNPVANCNLDPHYNNTSIYPSAERNRSIFRHLGEAINWLMNISEQTPGLEWAYRMLDLGTPPWDTFWLGLSAKYPDRRLFEEGSRVLIATMTFTIEDSTTICIDSCFWPPAERLWVFTADCTKFIPRHNLPYCFSVSFRVAGDVNADGMVTASDAIYLQNYLFRHGPAPIPIERGDTNCNQDIDPGDIVMIINYLFRSGPEPSC